MDHDASMGHFAYYITPALNKTRKQIFEEEYVCKMPEVTITIKFSDSGAITTLRSTNIKEDCLQEVINNCPDIASEGFKLDFVQSKKRPNVFQVVGTRSKPGYAFNKTLATCTITE